MNAQQLPGMPHPWPLRVTRAGDGRAVAVHAGPILLSAFRADDMEMRDLTICALTEGSRFQGKTVAAAFGIQPSQVSRIRSRYREHGARGLVHQMGRPPLLNPSQLRQARTWAGQGLTHAETGRKLSVSRSRISELLKQHGVLPSPSPLFDDIGADGEQAAPAHRPAPRITTAGRTPATAPTARAGRARAGGWRRGSRPGRWRAGMPGRCWCTPSPTGSAHGAC